jgi:hypothetical protein
VDVNNGALVNGGLRYRNEDGGSKSAPINRDAPGINWLVAANGNIPDLHVAIVEASIVPDRLRLEQRRGRHDNKRRLVALTKTRDMTVLVVRDAVHPTASIFGKELIRELLIGD